MADFYPVGDDQARIRWTIIDALRRYGTDSGRIGHAFAELHQLQAADLRALVAIMSAEGNGTPLTAGQLREQLGLSSGGASLVIDRLERAGHIRRARDHPADNRVVHLRYTDQGRATGLAFFGSLGDRARAILDGFTGDELQVIARFITAMADSTRQHVQELEGRLPGCARPSRKKRPRGPTPGRATPARPGSSAPRRRGACGGKFLHPAGSPRRMSARVPRTGAARVEWSWHVSLHAACGGRHGGRADPRNRGWHGCILFIDPATGKQIAVSDFTMNVGEHVLTAIVARLTKTAAGALDATVGTTLFTAGLSSARRARWCCSDSNADIGVR